MIRHRHRHALIAAAFVATVTLPASPARAELVGPCAELVQEAISIDGASRDVWRVYVRVDDPTDAIEFVSGNDEHPLVIESLDGPFYQNEDAGPNDIEPNGLVFPAFPDLEWDSFVTIGRATLDFAAGPTTTQFAFPPSGPGFQGSLLLVDGGAWYRLPGNPATIAGPELRVLVGQFTVPHGGRLEGVMRVAARIDGDPGTYLDQAFTAPGPDECACEFCPNGVPADTNNDGVVNADDLVNVMLDWGTTGMAHNGDVNDDGYVDADDLLAVILAMTPAA